MPTVSCQQCGNKMVSGGLFCPRCLDEQVSADASWFPVDKTGIDNPVVTHELVPDHRIYPEQKISELLRTYNIEKTDLPLIRKDDKAIQHLEIAPGDVIEIVRDSRTTDIAKSYRLIVSTSGESGEGSFEEWRSPGNPAEDVYEFRDNVSEEQALHILRNLRAYVAPSDPGACRRIAVDRKSEIETAVDRLRRGEPYTFIEGELGYGKSFFLHWVRDEAFAWAAVSLIDLGDETSFANPATIVKEFRQRLETPRSIANNQYANGLDELWDTLLRQVSDICASGYERRGYQLRKRRVSESIRLAMEDILAETNISKAIRTQLAETAADHFDTEHKSISHTLFENFPDEAAFDQLELISTMAQLNGLRLLIGVDELEKADRSSDHFDAIVDFVDNLPENASLFVTGTPELVEGGEEGNALHSTHRELYDLTIDNRIALERPTQKDLELFTDRLLSMEEIALDPPEREYEPTVEEFGGTDAAVNRFLSERTASFRSYLEFLEA